MPHNSTKSFEGAWDCSSRTLASGRVGAEMRRNCRLHPPPSDAAGVPSRGRASSETGGIRAGVASGEAGVDGGSIITFAECVTCGASPDLRCATHAPLEIESGAWHRRSPNLRRLIGDQFIPASRAPPIPRKMWAGPKMTRPVQGGWRVGRPQSMAARKFGPPALPAQMS
jgi:hypothetical protein